MYGVELTSASGHKFVIPDSNPFTFHKKYTASVVYGQGPTQQIIDTGIPANVKTMAFFRVGEPSDPGGAFFRFINWFVQNGTWHFSAGTPAHTLTVHAYVFTDREFFDVNGAGYGVQIFDAEGNQIIGCNSRPLKIRIEPYRYIDPPLISNLGYPAAITPSIMKTHKWSWSIWLDFGSVNTVVGEGNGYSTYTKEIGTNENRIQYDSNNYPQVLLCINSAEYD